MSRPAGNLVFLLGAGASVALGLPSTANLTRRVLGGEQVCHHTDGVYYLAEPNPKIADAYTPRALAVVRWVASYLERHFFPYGRQVNYEDVAYVLDQVVQAVKGEYENPALQPFINHLYHGLTGLLAQREYEAHPEWSCDEIVEESLNYVRDVVWHLLSVPPKDLTGLAMVGEACSTDDERHVDVATLNHDVALEEYFRGLDIKCVDGFGDAINGIRYWEPEHLEEQSRVRLLKLHGSINWFQFISEGDGLSVGIPEDWDVWHTFDIRGQMRWPTKGRPELLCGTFNKILYYQNPIYADLHFQFFAALRGASRMVVAGYSFGDKAVNGRLWDWMQRGSGVMVVVHPDPNALLAQARPGLAAGLVRWKEQGRLSVIAKGLQECRWREVSDDLGRLA